MELSTFETSLYGKNWRPVDGLDNLHYNMKERREAIKLYGELLATIPLRPGAAPSAKWMSTANALYALLDKYFIPTVPPTGEEALAQIREYVFGWKVVGQNQGGGRTWPEKERDPDWEVASKDFDDERWMTAWHATFAVMLLRRALKHDSMPMVRSAGWAQFAKVYCGLVMQS